MAIVGRTFHGKFANADVAAVVNNPIMQTRFIQMQRPFAYDTSWQHARVIVRVSCQAAPIGYTQAVPRPLAIGFCSSSGRGFSEYNSVANFVGMSTQVGGTAGAGTTSLPFPTFQCCHRAGTTESKSGLTSACVVPTAVRSVFAVDIIKGAPIWFVIGYLRNNSAADNDVDDTEWGTYVDGSALPSFNVRHTSITTAFDATAVVDEATNGTLDSFCFFFGTGGPLVEVHDFAVKVLP